jgi:hypothetical protein
MMSGISGPEAARARITVESHLALSATINWHLAARKIDLGALLRVILGPARVSDRAPLLETLSYLRCAYGERRRKSGPAAVLHCLRTAAMLARIMPEPGMLDLLGALLHDKEEDLTREELGATEWGHAQAEFARVLAKIDADHRWFLGERIALLRRRDDQTYYQYLGHVLGKSSEMPDLLHCKLADRLDNTMDIAVQRPPTDQHDFFETAFGVLFLPNYQMRPQDADSAPDSEACVLLISQLFKNVVLMSMLREKRLDSLDDVTNTLFAALAAVGRAQAEWGAVALLMSAIASCQERRQLVLEIMEYCAAGGIAAVTRKERGGLLDGSLLEHFAEPDDKLRKRRLENVYGNKPLFIRLMVMFIGIFTVFMTDPTYYLRGIDASGLHPVDPG